MDIYINAAQSISPQDTYLKDIPLEPLSYSTRLQCVIPNYADLFNPIARRRMSSIIKMGVATANACIKEAGIESPDAINTGTGLGCVFDTEVFLKQMVSSGEGILNPSSFIQSTHNTVGAQCALRMKSHGHNLAYVHKGSSFQSAVLDSILLMKEGKAKNILVGGIDEITEENYNIKKHISLWKEEPFDNLSILNEKGNGVIPGEGAAFFVLSTEKAKNSYGKIAGPLFWFRLDKEKRNEAFKAGLKSLGVECSDIDVLLSGINGINAVDDIYQTVANDLFPHASHACYKHLFGEFDTAPALGLWTATRILKQKEVPHSVLIKKGRRDEVKNVLIHDMEADGTHTLMLLSDV